jgi:hypothetical protein
LDVDNSEGIAFNEFSKLSIMNYSTKEMKPPLPRISKSTLNMKNYAFANGKLPKNKDLNSFNVDIQQLN